MKKQIFAAIIAACVIFTVVGYAVPGVAFAAESDIDVSKYTDVLDDLQRDDSFNADSPSLWPTGTNELNVFQMAEGSEGELFLYVAWFSSWSPVITSINMSLTNEDMPDFHLFNLKMLNTNKGSSLTFGKFVVEGLSVSNDDIRFYNIASIYRVWDNSADVELLDDPSDEVACRVGKLFAAKTVDGVVDYAMDKTDIVTVTDKYPGNLFALDKAGFGSGHATMTHFIAFSTDHSIDQLVQAKVSYYEAPFTWDGDSFMDTSVNESEFVYGQSIYREKMLHYTSDISYSRGWYFSKKYTWKEIQTAESFISSTDLNDSAVAAIKNKQWVLVFAQSDVNFTIGNVPHVEGNNVREVTILELTFVTAGKPYKLGVVDNKDTSTSIDSATGWDAFVKSWNSFWQSIGNFFDRVRAWFSEYWWVVAIVGGLIAIGILAVIFKPVWTGVKWVLKILWYIISAPARLIVLIVTKVNERKNE